MYNVITIKIRKEETKMTTKYKVYSHNAVDCEGRRFRDVEFSDYVATYEEALEIAEGIATSCFPTDGWSIVARTIDEANFTVTDTVVKKFDYWEEIGKYEAAKRAIKRCIERIEELEKSIARSTNEKRIANKRKAIEEYKKEIEENKKMLDNAPTPMV
jgi:tetratricopeptide (TPR) repeat protein